MMDESILNINEIEDIEEFDELDDLEEVDDLEEFEDLKDKEQDLLGEEVECIIPNGRSSEIESPIEDSSDNLIFTTTKDTGDKFKLCYVNYKKIKAPSTRIRGEGIPEALVESIGGTGLLKPLDVIEFKDVYILVDGYKRYVACVKNDILDIPCVINTSLKAEDIDLLEAIHNHYSPYTNKEIINYVNYLEDKRSIYDANTIEFLLQLDTGDYTKLKDILSDGDEKIIEKLENDKLNISGAFKKLESRRRKESKEAKELKRASKVYNEDSSVVTNNLGDVGEVSNAKEDKCSKDTDIDGKDVENLFSDSEDKNLDDLVEKSQQIAGFEPKKQDYKNRERLSPELRRSVLARDNNECQICHLIKGEECTEILDVHHIKEVYLGGEDKKDNLITVCLCCHKQVHLYARGDLHIRKEAELNEYEKTKYKKIVELGTKIRRDLKIKGLNKSDLKKVDNAETIGRTKDGTQIAG